MRVEKTAAARADLLEHFSYIRQDNLDAERHFLMAARAAFEQLSRMPYMGRKR